MCRQLHFGLVITVFMMSYIYTKTMVQSLKVLFLMFTIHGKNENLVLIFNILHKPIYL